MQQKNISKTWIRINDDKHQYGCANADISGDPRIFGRVYIATNGLGVVYGDTNGTSIKLEGDANTDGTVDISDYIAVGKYIIDSTNYINKDNCDLNSDGKINTLDLALLREVVLQQQYLS